MKSNIVIMRFSNLFLKNIFAAFVLHLGVHLVIIIITAATANAYSAL